MQRRVAILYGTTEGQTRKIAEHLASRLRGSGADVAVMHCAELPEDWRPANADGIIVAASIHQAQFQRYVAEAVRREVDALNAMPSGLVCVSLNAALGEAADVPPSAYVERFVAETGWEPHLVHHAAGALRYTEYNWFKRQLMKHLAGRVGFSTDTGRDVELTDWQALDAFADAFLQHLSA